jgi:hypothetical protein
MPFVNKPHTYPTSSAPTLRNLPPRLALTYAASSIPRAFRRRLHARAARLLRSSGGAPTAFLHLCSARNAAESHTNCFLFTEFKNGWENTSCHRGCGKLECACSLDTLGIHAQIKRCVIKFSCSKSHLKTHLQMDFDYEEESEGSSDNILADECPAPADRAAFQFGFGSSKPGQNERDGDPIITVIDRSGVHEI